MPHVSLRGAPTETSNICPLQFALLSFSVVSLCSIGFTQLQLTYLIPLPLLSSPPFSFPSLFFPLVPLSCSRHTQSRVDNILLCWSNLLCGANKVVPGSQWR
jgi:hypothetical protein